MYIRCRGLNCIGLSEMEIKYKSVRSQGNAKNCQFNLIETVMLAHEDELCDKHKLNALWLKLTPEINRLGPPIYTESEWRLRWSQHKYYKSKTEKSNELSDMSQNSSSSSHEPSNSEQPLEVDFDIACSGNCHSAVSETLRLMTEERHNLKSVLIEKLDVLIEEHQKTNSLLKEILLSKNSSQ